MSNPQDENVEDPVIAKAVSDKEPGILADTVAAETASSEVPEQLDREQGEPASRNMTALMQGEDELDPGTADVTGTVAGDVPETPAWKKALGKAGLPKPRGEPATGAWVDKIDAIPTAPPPPPAPPAPTVTAEMGVALNQILNLKTVRDVEAWVEANPETAFAPFLPALPSFTRFMLDHSLSPDVRWTCDDEVTVLFTRGPDGRITKRRLSR